MSNFKNKLLGKELAKAATPKALAEYREQPFTNALASVKNKRPTAKAKPMNILTYVDRVQENYRKKPVIEDNRFESEFRRGKKAALKEFYPKPKVSSSQPIKIEHDITKHINEMKNFRETEAIDFKNSQRNFEKIMEKTRDEDLDKGLGSLTKGRRFPNE